MPPDIGFTNLNPYVSQLRLHTEGFVLYFIYAGNMDDLLRNILPTVSFVIIKTVINKEKTSISWFLLLKLLNQTIESVP